MRWFAFFAVFLQRHRKFAKIERLKTMNDNELI